MWRITRYVTLALMSRRNILFYMMSDVGRVCQKLYEQNNYSLIMEQLFALDCLEYFRKFWSVQKYDNIQNCSEAYKSSLNFLGRPLHSNFQCLEFYTTPEPVLKFYRDNSKLSPTDRFKRSQLFNFSTFSFATLNIL